MPKTASNTKTNRTCFGAIVNTSASDISVCNWFNTSTSFLTVQLTPIRTSCDWKISHNLIPPDDGNTKIMRGYRMNYILCAFILNLINTWKLNAINFFFTSTTLIRLRNVYQPKYFKVISDWVVRKWLIWTMSKRHLEVILFKILNFIFS